METEHAPEMLIALYTTLADAQAAMRELQDNGIPYPDIRMGAHTADDPERPAHDLPNLPGQYWSLAVVLDADGGDRGAEAVLQKHRPLAIGRQAAPNAGRSSTDRGAIAWRHYVFETDAATDAIAEAAGTTGMTGVISSGVFATGANAEGNPPATGLPPGGQRPADDETPPTTDDRQAETETEGHSRPTTELKP